jgi:hypothetical protein
MIISEQSLVIFIHVKKNINKPQLPLYDLLKINYKDHKSLHGI